MKFTDMEGREYECKVTLATAIALKKKLNVNLMGHFDGSLYDRLAEDPELLVNVLTETVRGTLDAHSIDESCFAQSLGGDTIEAAMLSLREAITDFSPPRQRAALKNLFEKMDRVQSLQMDQVEAEIAKINPEILNQKPSKPKKASKKTSSTSSSTSGGSAESSAGLPTNSETARSEK